MGGLILRTVLKQALKELIELTLNAALEVAQERFSSLKRRPSQKYVPPNR